MTTTPQTLIEELHSIDNALVNGTATPEQEQRGQELVTLANAAPKLLAALENFFNLMHDYECSVRKGYVRAAMQQSREVIMQAKGAVL